MHNALEEALKSLKINEMGQHLQPKENSGRALDSKEHGVECCGWIQDILLAEEESGCKILVSR